MAYAFPPYSATGTHKIRPDEPNGSLGIHDGLSLRSWRFNLLDLFKILLDPSQLGEDGMVLGINSVQAERSCTCELVKPRYLV